MTTRQSYQIAPDLFLVRQQVSSQADSPPPTVKNVNHVACIDVSGSMFHDLPKIREQLKRRVPKLLREGDTFSVVWFSGRGQCGALFEAEPVSTLPELQEVNQAIDRYLQPLGLTGFKEPLEEVTRLIARVRKKNHHPFALFFMSDGHDNQWPRTQVLDAIKDASAQLASTTIVEYGNYADRQLLAQMAARAGGTVIASENFDQYAPVFEEYVQRRVSCSPRVLAQVEGDVVGGFAFAIGDEELLTFEVSGSDVLVPENREAIWYLSPRSQGKMVLDLVTCTESVKVRPPGGVSEPDPAIDAAYAAISLFATRMQPKVVLPLLAATGDVHFVEQFGGCFAKQAYSQFTTDTRRAVFSPELRLTEGWDPTRVPPPDAFTVLDFLRVLSSDESNRVLLDSSDFSYTRIGRPAVQVDETLKFTADKQPDGYPVASLTYNEERPNISILVRKEGTVDLTDKRAELDLPKCAKVPVQFPTFIFRNYAVVRDGIINIERLPVRMTAKTVRELWKAGFPSAAVLGTDSEPAETAVRRVKKAPAGRMVSFVVDLKRLPVVNRNMTRDVSARELLLKEWELTKARAAQKVFNSVKKERFPRESEGFKIVYGEAAADWLKELGITDYSGFSPKVKLAEAQDQYPAKELVVSLKGLASLPSVKEAREKIASGKATARHRLFEPALDEIASHEKAIGLLSKPDNAYEAWLSERTASATAEVRRLLREMSQVRFGVVVGQTWFTEFSSLDETTLEVVLDGQKVEGSVEMREVMVDV